MYTVVPSIHPHNTKLYLKTSSSYHDFPYFSVLSLSRTVFNVEPGQFAYIAEPCCSWPSSSSGSFNSALQHFPLKTAMPHYMAQVHNLPLFDCFYQLSPFFKEI